MIERSGGRRNGMSGRRRNSRVNWDGKDEQPRPDSDDDQTWGDWCPGQLS